MTAAGLTARTCERHPERPAAARCMACGRVLCQECTTTWEGINHCAACLAARGRRATRGTSVVAVAAWLFVVAFLLVAAVELGLVTGVGMAQSFQWESAD